MVIWTGLYLFDLCGLVSILCVNSVESSLVGLIQLAAYFSFVQFGGGIMSGKEFSKIECNCQ